MAKWIAIAAAAALSVPLLAGLVYEVWLNRVAADPAYFESAIAAFEERDAQAMPPPGGIVFVGSSSIRFWDTLHEDMAPLPVIQRGFGGAHMEHVVHNLRRIVVPYAPRAVVVFVGGNDLSSGKSAMRVASDYRAFLELLHGELPEAEVWILSMKPSKWRWSLWGEMQALDAQLLALAESDPRVRFVETGRTLLGSNGQPDEVYIFDGLHLNAEGYRRWTALLKPLLLAAYQADLES